MFSRISVLNIAPVLCCHRYFAVTGTFKESRIRVLSIVPVLGCHRYFAITGTLLSPVKSSYRENMLCEEPWFPEIFRAHGPLSSHGNLFPCTNYITSTELTNRVVQRIFKNLNYCRTCVLVPTQMGFIVSTTSATAAAAAASADLPRTQPAWPDSHTRSGSMASSLTLTCSTTQNFQQRQQRQHERQHERQQSAPRGTRRSRQPAAGAHVRPARGRARG